MPDDEIEDDASLWAYVIRSIMPLKRERSAPVKAARPPAQVKRVPTVEIFPPAKPTGLSLSSDGPPGLDRRSDDRLRRGHMEIEARIDLHGMTVAQAHPTLRQFLTGAQGRGLRCVLIITGKGRDGQGIIRQSLSGWLADPPLRDIVLRHYPAKPKDGGTGAFYILLRRVRD